MVKKPVGWLFWFVAALFYAYEMLHRVAPSVLTTALRQDLQINSHQLGMVAAMYFYAYAAFQLPAGLLIDKYGPKRILSLASLSVAIGSLIFTLSYELNMIYLSRFIIGGGSAFAFVSCLRIGGQWLTMSSFPLVVGLTNLFGTIGALSGGQPLSYIALSIGWRETFMWVTAFGAILTMLILFMIPTKHSHQKHVANQHNFWDGLILIMKTPKAWVIALFGALVVAPIAAIPELWGVEFLKTAYSIDETRASSMTHTIFMGTAVGGPLIGWFSTNRNSLLIMRLATMLALILLSGFIYWQPNNFLFLYFILFFFGIFSANMLLCFSMMTKLAPNWAQGAAIGFTNMIIMIIAGIVQHSVGLVLDKLVAQGDGIYHLNDYHIAFAILPISLSLAVVLTLTLKSLHKVD
jgi:predicted MFS family arabinose efflux permease